MYWNLLCRIVEKGHLDNVLHDPFKLFQEIKLFKFNDKSSINCKRKNTLDSLGYDSFRLPFPKIAIEDPWGIGIYIDSENDQFGLHGKRVSIVFLGTQINSKNGILQVATISKVDLKAQDMHCDFHFLGTVTNGKLVNKFSKEHELFRFFKIDLTEDEADEHKGFFGQRLYNVISLINPKNFILKETTLNVKSKKKRLLRAHQRPNYTILEPSKIREIMHIKTPPAGSHRSPIPHERSGHFRTLRHPKYGENVGKTVWIKPVWVGDSESIVGNKFYKVIL